MKRAGFAFDGESLITPDMIDENIVQTEPISSGQETAIAFAHVALLLEVTRQRLSVPGSERAAIATLFSELHKARARFAPSVWRDLVPMIQGHPVAAIVHEDPFTHRSFEKPRGYSGDAGLLDFIYEHPSMAEEMNAATARGKAINAYTNKAPAAAAVRERRRILAREVDGVAARVGADTEILTIAAGHLREAELCDAYRTGVPKRWVALDQDPMSIGIMMRDLAQSCVEPINGSVRGILKGEYTLGTFDFVYAAGLYDYLPEPVAIKLTQACLAMLKPGGRFLLANFADDIVDDGFMETMMNWSLLLRSDADVWRIVNASVDRNGADIRVERGENGNIIYAVIEKRNG
ncbi:class I SAM-dependent methyltransferase [Fulvimarina sp. 2208YS6-2-32]|uniref:Class I SAM-dependent methyltransferase n=1 Tax=Fulvimarina uroteuthidis TaxID=3098149 RepID=A0ABU5HX94_9HYPH|nr:class I SAM-dependent methyltransferase [Fulvimarina sp. 2208YS6-2-32]MDY8107660.1 class I SAM-dependent methyltransferase [Fulvimarina sp. 2208YS6-2-32]